MNNLAEEDSKVEIINWYKSLLKGIVELKNFELKISIGSSVEQVSQTARRVPHYLREL